MRLKRQWVMRFPTRLNLWCWVTMWACIAALTVVVLSLKEKVDRYERENANKPWEKPHRTETDR